MTGRWSVKQEYVRRGMSKGGMSCTERQRPVVPRADDSVFSVEITLALVSTFLIHQSDWIPPHEAVEAYEHVFGSGYGLNRQIEIQNIAVVYMLAHVHGTNFHHRFVAFTLLLLLNVKLKHFYTITLLIHIVRRPCCVSALTSP